MTEELCDRLYIKLRLWLLSTLEVPWQQFGLELVNYILSSSSCDPVVMILVAQDKILVPRSLGCLAYHHLVIETDPLIQL